MLARVSSPARPAAMFAIGAIVSASAAAPASAQQPAPPPDVRVEGHSFLPELREFDPALVRELQTPAGFSVSVFAQDLNGPRIMAVADDGTVYVTRPSQNDVLALRDTDGDGVADTRVTAISELEGVHGIALHDGRVYLAASTILWAADVREDGTFGGAMVLADGLPDGGQHPNRTLHVRDGWIYLSVGSSCNACPEPNPEHATLLRIRPDGSGREVFAEGLRNTIGFAWHPTTGELWGVDHGSDWRGDDVPPEELNRIVEGRHYGWPFCYADRQIDDVMAQAPEDQSKAEFCAATEPAALTFQAHSAPMQMAFYDGALFPADYHGDAFVALRGSWNRKPAVGYQVARIRFDEGQPTGIDEFVTGFLIEEGGAHFGRPVGIVVGADGALLIGDDTNGVIYRIAYEG